MTQQNKSECSNCGRDGDELGGVVCRECSGLDEVQEELATLKREHEQLRAAALPYATEIFNTGDELRARERLALRAALDATTAEPVRETFDAQAVRELLARSETAAEALRTRAGFLEQACRALRDSEKKEKP